MTTVTLKTAAGKDAGSLDLAADVFGVQPNVPLMHQVVTAQLAARRAGTQSTKTRAEVSGGGKKPFKQKGTGNARQGSTRAPHYSGGGVALGPKPRKYDQKTPKKMIKLALRSALSDRAADGKVIVVDSWGFDAPKTKSAKAALNALGIDGKALVVVDIDDVNTIKSFLNLREVQLIERGELNAYDVLCNDYVVFTKANVPTGDAAPAVVADAPAKKAPAKKAAAKADTPAAAVAAFADIAADAPATDAAATDAAEGKALPAGAVAPNADGSAPEGYEIKGNADSGLYHVPGSAFYNRTEAEFYFATAADAEAAGFQLPPSQRKKADDEKGAE
jgi:large subunit ribosomal protein L4